MKITALEDDNAQVGGQRAADALEVAAMAWERLNFFFLNFLRSKDSGGFLCGQWRGVREDP